MGLLDRLLRRRPAPPPSYDPADPSLEVLVRAPDAARADSAVLAEAAQAGVDVEAPMLVRHLLVGLPGDAAVGEARALLAQDGYAVVPGPADAAPRAVWACRTEVVTGLSASRERSRMAGLAQRLGGDVAGWEGLRPPAGGPA
ncbi:MAG TPA: ribonuclease E inhibitor RraB [Mycobacteriales bacterium]|nr:ribonuclease E inhibitor RraB [Mycobacteriales bacterium]